MNDPGFVAARPKGAAPRPTLENISSAHQSEDAQDGGGRLAHTAGSLDPSDVGHGVASIEHYGGERLVESSELEVLQQIVRELRPLSRTSRARILEILEMML